VKARKFWGSISQKTTLLFLTVAVLSILILIWMGLRLIQQDRELESQQFEDNREAAADRLTAELDSILSSELDKLADPEAAIAEAEDDFVLLWTDAGKIIVSPENALLYYPEVPFQSDIPPGLFKEADRAEFENNNYERAISLLRPLSNSRSDLIRAAAQIRLARILRKAERMTDAIEIYSELADYRRYSSVSLSGVPIDLLARSTLCSLLEDLGEFDRLEPEASRLFRDLNNRIWRLDRSSYFLHVDRAANWIGNKPESDVESLALAESVLLLWESLHETGPFEPASSGSRAFSVSGTSVTLLWMESGDSLAIAAAGPGAQRSRWFEPLFCSPEYRTVSVCVSGGDGTWIYGQKPRPDIPSTVRSSLVSGLPWDLTLVDSGLASELSQFAQRRRLMILGLGLLVLLIVAVSYLISRAVSRELAAARLQADFVSAVSHEFRTPLTSLRQFTEMLNEDESLVLEKRRSFHQAQARATNRLSRLVESFLDFGRMEAGARPYRMERMDVGEMAREVVKEYLEEIDSGDRKIVCTAAGEGLVVHGDREALAQALWNLIDNAVKYSAAGECVRVEVNAGDPVEIKVHDRGIGIPSSEKKRILRKFVRGRIAQEQGIKGTGIGLAVVNHIVEAHGGEIQIDSEPDRGSTFSIRLPAGG
jgi:signal transduction histidine kinase